MNKQAAKEVVCRKTNQKVTWRITLFKPPFFSLFFFFFFKQQKSAKHWMVKNMKWNHWEGHSKIPTKSIKDQPMKINDDISSSSETAFWPKEMADTSILIQNTTAKTTIHVAITSYFHKLVLNIVMTNGQKSTSKAATKSSLMKHPDECQHSEGRKYPNLWGVRILMPKGTKKPTSNNNDCWFERDLPKKSHFLLLKKHTLTGWQCTKTACTFWVICPF